MKKTTMLKNLICSSELGFLMEAHNGMSAKIVEETGFEGIWASGLAMSAAMGVRDSNEASWTQVLEVLEFMSDITSIPILLDMLCYLYYNLRVDAGKSFLFLNISIIYDLKSLFFSIDIQDLR